MALHIDIALELVARFENFTLDEKPITPSIEVLELLIDRHLCNKEWMLKNQLTYGSKTIKRHWLIPIMTGLTEEDQKTLKERYEQVGWYSVNIIRKSTNEEMFYISLWDLN